jgi:hypothetical protein
MNPENRNIVNLIKSEIESALCDSKNLEICRQSIWKILNDKYLKNEITDFKISVNRPGIQQRREITIQSLLDDINPDLTPILNKFDVTLQLKNQPQYININVVQAL